MPDTLTLIEKTAFLKSTELFASVPTEMLVQLASRAKEHHFDGGQTVFREGEPNTGAYMVVDGLIEIRKGRALEGVRGPGLGFGELALGEGEPHGFTATALVPTYLLCVSNEAFFETVVDVPEVAVAMLRFMGRRIAEQAQRVHHLEGQIAHLNATIQQAGLETPTYTSGAYRRPEGLQSPDR